MSNRIASGVLTKVLRNKIADMAEKIESNFIAIATLIFGVLIMYNLVLRLFNLQGLSWVEEGARYMLVVTTLMGCSIGAKYKMHLVMDSVVTSVPPVIGHSLRTVAFLLCSIMYLYLGYYGIKWTGRLIAMNRTIECISFPLWPIWVFVDYALVTMGLRYFVESVFSLKSAIKKESMVSLQDEEIAKAIEEGSQHNEDL